jgi:Zinc finger, C2H2 type/C2H2-type zinc finger
LKLRNHECRVCQSTFFTAWKLKRHMITHLPEDSPLQTPCPECDKVFKHPSAMKEHLKYHKPPQHRCNICQKEYHNYTSLTSHIKITHKELRNFECKYCDSTYPKNCSLNRHILTAHLKQKLSCQVEGCQKTFPLHERYRGELW